YQALLDDVSQQINQTPGYMDFAVDDYILPENGLAGEGEDINHIYLCNREGIVNLETNNDWNRIYAQILRANIVLEGLESLMSQSHESAFKEAKGGALFFRSWHFFHLIQLFSKPYNPQTSKTDPGIVLKLKADINENAGITSVETCYKQI